MCMINDDDYLEIIRVSALNYGIKTITIYAFIN